MAPVWTHEIVFDDSMNRGCGGFSILWPWKSLQVSFWNVMHAALLTVLHLNCSADLFLLIRMCIRFLELINISAF